MLTISVSFPNLMVARPWTVLTVATLRVSSKPDCFTCSAGCQCSYYWPAYGPSIVLQADVCRLSSLSVVCNAGRVGGRPPLGRARQRSGGRQCTAVQYGYVPLGQYLVQSAFVSKNVYPS